MKRLVNAITCTRFVFALILVLAVLLGQGTAVGFLLRGVRLGLGRSARWSEAAAGRSTLEELVLVLRAWTPAPDVRGLLWIEKPRR